MRRSLGGSDSAASERQCGGGKLAPSATPANDSMRSVATESVSTTDAIESCCDFIPGCSESVGNHLF